MLYRVTADMVGTLAREIVAESEEEAVEEFLKTLDIDDLEWWDARDSTACAEELE